MLVETDFVDYPIAINATFEKVYVHLHSIIGFIAITLSCFVIYLVTFKSKFLGKEYMYCLLVLKIFVLLYDINDTIINLPFMLLPCKGVYIMGLAPLIGMSAQMATVISVSSLSGVCAWFNCCLFHRHQMIMPYDHVFKLSERKCLLVYFIMNSIMFINPIIFIFTQKDDKNEQRPISTMSWLLHKPSYMIWTEDNTPAMMRFHFPYLMVTFVLCTLTTTFLTRHSIRVMKSRAESISASTMALQQRLISSLCIQMNVQSVGVSFPVIFWLILFIPSLVAPDHRSFVAPEASAAVYGLILATSIINSIYTIASTRKYRQIVSQYARSVFCTLKDRTSDSPQFRNRSPVIPRASISHQFTVSHVPHASPGSNRVEIH